MQRADFAELFEIMAGLPVTIRLLDPPLHEFLPHEEKEAAAVAKELGVPLEKLQARVAELHEFNPMLGFRGCRLAIRYPEITEMQARAIFEAAVERGQEDRQAGGARGDDPAHRLPPASSTSCARVIVKTAQAVEKETGAKLDYQIGTMIELPRAALKADEIAAGEAGAEFFSFGTNDLTQTCLGLSRDDAAPILANYMRAGRSSRSTRSCPSIRTASASWCASAPSAAARCAPDLKVGICGEHGGDPASIAFFNAAGLDYVSCSPFRVPVARLAAAQAAIRAKQ